MGGPNFAATVPGQTVSGNGNPGVQGISPNGNGVEGRSGAANPAVPVGFGVVGIGGVHGTSEGGPGVQGRSTQVGVDGRSLGGRAGVQGRSLSGPGVQGRSSTGIGVQGSSATNIGVDGRSNGSAPGVAGSSVSGVGVRAEGGVWGSQPPSGGPALVAYGWGSVGIFAQSAFSDGIEANTNTRIGVLGRAGTLISRTKDGVGVYGTSTVSGGAGIRGHHNGSDPGVEGSSGSGSGVEGTSGSGAGVKGDSGTGSGVEGTSSSATGSGVRGTSTSASTIGDGVRGTSTNGRGVLGTSTNGDGVRGTSTNGRGVVGISGIGAGVFGQCDFPDASLNRVGGLFNGGLKILNGDKPFTIDHPLDPENKYLVHTSVESSERKNVYDGVVRLDEDGAVWVELPEWFEALNRDFRYQLTAIGGSAPNLHVAEEISENRFKIAGGEEGLKVCWQVTGSRKDPWAAANPFEVEQVKREEERGRYLDPSVYGAPKEQRIMLEPIAEAVEEEQLAPEPSGIDFVRLEEEDRRRTNELLRPVEGPELEEFLRRMEREEEEEEEST